jgi:hypothetical protein
MWGSFGAAVLAVGWVASARGAGGGGSPGRSIAVTGSGWGHNWRSLKRGGTFRRFSGCRSAANLPFLGVCLRASSFTNESGGRVFIDLVADSALTARRRGRKRLGRELTSLPVGLAQWRGGWRSAMSGGEN